MPKQPFKFFGYGAIMIVFAIVWLAFGNLIIKITDVRVGVVDGTTYEKMTRQWNHVKEVKLYQDEQLIFKELETEEIDVAITDRLMGLYLISKNGYRDLKPAGNIIDREMVGVAFRRQDKTLRQAFNRGLKEVIENGTYSKISRKYFGVDILKGMQYQTTYPNEPPAADDSWKDIKRKGQIVFTMLSDYPPYTYFNEQGIFSGFDVELARAVCERLGLQCVPIIAEWDQALEGLKLKHYDGAWGGLIIKSQAGYVQYSNPCYLTGVQLFSRKDSPVNGPEALKKTVKMPISFPVNFQFLWCI